MDFFEAQARAKARSSKLVVMFTLAVIGTIVAMYFASLAIFGLLRERSSGVEYDRYGQYVGYDGPSFIDTLFVWNPSLFTGVAFTTLAVVGLGSLFKWSQFSSGGGAVAESVGGRRVDPNTRDLRERRLLNVVEEMAIASGVSMPAVYILDQEPAINAFAAGLTTNDAAVAVTRGTLEKLNRDELQGVIGHEFSHILNGDMRLNLRIAATIFGILALGLIGRGILWSMRHVRTSRGKNSGNIVVVLLAIGLACLIIGYVGYFFGRLIQAAVSRQREFLADASAVQFTRNPAGLSGALKKIGGYALGSTMANNQSAAIGHFFFAQAFRTGITGLWATHPPIDERIRAVDPHFDGKFFEPPEVVDVDRESFTEAGLTRPTHPMLAGEAARGLHSAPAHLGSRAARSPVPAVEPRPIGPGLRAAPPPARSDAIPPLLPVTAPVSALASAGTLTAEQITNAQLILDTTPARLREATQSAFEARVLLFGLLLDDDPAIRERQRGVLRTRHGDSESHLLARLEDPLRQVRDEQRLPLVQLSLAALKALPAAEVQPFLATLDELIRADQAVTPFEFALDRIVRNALAGPARAVAQVYSFHAVTDEIAVVLSVLAHAATATDADAPRAFAAGAAQIKLIEPKLAYDPARALDFATFDTALARLASASLPIKQRTLIAAAHVVQADGRVLVREYELLRATAAALDVPMPPLAARAE